ncbi:EscU/YscU/HrcU family type III secretion system export apparatus switch protein [Blastococcus sp. PRF04-17]|uniref:EscU/YscU/HrcU family type III secretion system export apparatus switch protein n=1 Tax=Blastococcus sp. PRF04-17 TaxID=2933797 RepID=UPI001FF362DD|nr:EscU/YscU/HrcU family type III secretion system export apparatus switch protein [Blastococcus sp. PRF04-17]UOY03934.1 EscU/YscU/HrcU family type III secretion system export apparatus switch protein [Blastococcus sp. PRF04-17]
MAKDGPGGEKTEKPTPQRLKKARKEGQIPRTQELGTWLGVAAASVLLPMLVGNAFDEVRKLIVQVGSVAHSPEPEKLLILLGQALTAFMITILPLGVGMMVVGTAAAASQGGVAVATKSMKPTWKKLNPFPGMKRMFGTQGLWEATKAVIKTAALGTVVIVTSDRAQELVASAGALPLSAVTTMFTDSAILMFRVVAVTGLVIAAADYLVVRKKTMKQLQMSKYEIKQENKQAEGDPYMKAHRRGVQLSMSRNRMMAEVADADVLLVNPTHYAVALKYDPTKGAPRVVAKGAGEIATKLREVATDARVPLVQDIPLTRALHASCDLGQEVPAQLFTAVARVLAFVMHLGAKGVKGGFHRPGFEAPEVEGLPKAGRRRAAA